jgi:branched-chain amino acid transport system permease protein
VATGWIFYIFTLLIFAVVFVIAAQALHLQYGVAGVPNFALVIFQAAGAYAAGVLALPPDGANGGFQQYVLGWGLPFPLPWVGGAIAGGLLALPVGLIILRRLRADYQAVTLLVLTVILNTVITNAVGFVNGSQGLALIPAPLTDFFDQYSIAYVVLMTGVLIAVALLVFFFVRLLVESPWGRSLRAMREDEQMAMTVGKNVVRMKLTVFIVGGALAGLSGAVLATAIGVWSPGAWLFPETFTIFAAIIVGGLGNANGSIVGVVLVPILFLEATRFLPPIGHPYTLPAVELVVVGLLILGVLWFRPSGAIPERRRRSRVLGRARTLVEPGSEAPTPWSRYIRGFEDRG